MTLFRFGTFSNALSKTLIRSLNSSSALSNNPITSKSIELVKKSIHDAQEEAKIYSKHVDDAVATWSKCNDVYYGKDRDLKNFPPLHVPDQHPKVRLGFIPDSWFQALYPKTGVTGPYMFGIGLLTYLMSKEIVVYDAHFAELFPFVICTTWLIKEFGPQISKQCDAYAAKLDDTQFNDPIKKVKDNLDKTIETAQEEIARADAVPLLVKAKQEVLALEMEHAYRARLTQVHKAVQRRLDYHVARDTTRKSYQQDHMVKWIVNSVKKGITPQQEKETIANCIAELRRLAQMQGARA